MDGERDAASPTLVPHLYCHIQPGTTTAACWRAWITANWMPASPTLYRDCTARTGQYDDRGLLEGLDHGDPDALDRHHLAALMDADSALEMSPDHVRAHLRRAQALSKLGRWVMEWDRRPRNRWAGRRWHRCFDGRQLCTGDEPWLCASAARQRTGAGQAQMAGTGMGQ